MGINGRRLETVRGPEDTAAWSELRSFCSYRPSRYRDLQSSPLHERALGVSFVENLPRIVFVRRNKDGWDGEKGVGEMDRCAGSITMGVCFFRMLRIKSVLIFGDIFQIFWRVDFCVFDFNFEYQKVNNRIDFFFFFNLGEIWLSIFMI